MTLQTKIDAFSGIAPIDDEDQGWGGEIGIGKEEDYGNALEWSFLFELLFFSILCCITLVYSILRLIYSLCSPNVLTG